MSHKITILPEEKLILVVFEGVIGYEDIVEAGLELKQHPDFSESFCGVNDFRRCEKNLSPDDYERLTQRVAYKKGSDVRWCSINSTAKETALSLLFQSNLKDIHKLEVFTTVEAASEFLGKDLTKVLEI